MNTHVWGGEESLFSKLHFSFRIAQLDNILLILVNK